MTEEIQLIDEELEVIEPPTQLAIGEWTPEEKRTHFNAVIEELRWLQHKIDDVSTIAAKYINEYRKKYNWRFEENRHFLKEYAQANLKRSKTTGEIRGKSFTPLGSVGGVFFRQKPKKIIVAIAHEKLCELFEFLNNRGENSSVTKTTVVNYTLDPEALLNDLHKLAVKKVALASKDDNSDPDDKDKIEVMYKQLLDNFNITIEDVDPFHYMNVGSGKAWSNAKSKSLLSQALDGNVPDEAPQLMQDPELLEAE